MSLKELEKETKTTVYLIDGKWQRLDKARYKIVG